MLVRWGWCSICQEEEVMLTLIGLWSYLSWPAEVVDSLRTFRCTVLKIWSSVSTNNIDAASLLESVRSFDVLSITLSRHARQNTNGLNVVAGGPASFDSHAHTARMHEASSNTPAKLASRYRACMRLSMSATEGRTIRPRKSCRWSRDKEPTGMSVNKYNK